VRRIAGYPVPVLVAVRGQCLGGALEIATAGHLIFAAPTAQFGQPEIRLGVFAPAASCILTGRIGRMAAEDLLISGRSISAGTARDIGLVAAVDPEPEAAALAYFDKHLEPKSASSLRYAVAAARGGFCRQLDEMLDGIERLYLDELMATHDAAEGIAAFLARRPAKWENR
jgi:cyclohexa-1,5-dienecarbonyl-CoA hydratase